VIGATNSMHELTQHRARKQASESHTKTHTEAQTICSCIYSALSHGVIGRSGNKCALQHPFNGVTPPKVMLKSPLAFIEHTVDTTQNSNDA
jgi:hypothetical protein